MISTSLRIASTPAATWAISRSSGPRTAATMQNSVAPDLAVCLAASTRLGMSSRALRTGDSNRPDCEQKWQSSGQPPVFRLMMPSTSTSGPHQRIRTSWARASSSSSRSSGSRRTCSTWSRLSPSPRSSTCRRASARMSVSSAPVVGRVAACVTRYSPASSFGRVTALRLTGRTPSHAMRAMARRFGIRLSCRRSIGADPRTCPRSAAGARRCAARGPAPAPRPGGPA